MGMLPVMIVTGIIYIFVADGTIVMESAKWLSIIHTLMAFVIIAFVIMHVYMTSTGETITEYTKGMINGYEEIEH
jgi:thiosulfate reductase cytochrome b subunit